MFSEEKFNLYSKLIEVKVADLTMPELHLVVALCSDSEVAKLMKAKEKKPDGKDK